MLLQVFLGLELPMEEEILFWSRLNTAVAGFCCQAAIEDDPLQSLVSAMVGDGAYVNE